MKVLNFQILNFKISNLKTSNLTQNVKKSNSNDLLSSDDLKINQRCYYKLLIQDFEADFLWKVGLKIMNAGIILKSFIYGL